jgi:hypothetical protein
MSRYLFVAIVAILVVSGCQFFASMAKAGEDVAATVKVSTADIGARVTLIGRLGQPLGTMLTIEGTWGYPNQSRGPTKDYPLLFTVSRVNGTRLKTPIVFHGRQVSAYNKQGKSVIPPHEQQRRLDGAAWILRGYETGRFTVIPAGYWNEFGKGMIPQSPAQEPFATELVGVLQQQKQPATKP